MRDRPLARHPRRSVPPVTRLMPRRRSRSPDPSCQSAGRTERVIATVPGRPRNGSGEARSAGQIRVVSNSRRRSRCRTRISGTVSALDLGVLDGQQPTRAEQPAGRERHAADRVQAVDAGEQGDGRIVVSGLGRHRGERLERNVGRVGDHQIDACRRVRGERARGPRRAARRWFRRGCAEPRPAHRPRARRRGPRPRAPRWPELSRSPRTRCRDRPRWVGGPARTSSSSRTTAQPVITSVSGLGTNTPGPTASSR